MRSVALSLVVAGLLSMTVVANASSVLFDRGLPAANLNDGAARSNVCWAEPDPTTGRPSNYFDGDDFTIGTAGQSYVIDSITVWGAQYNPLSTDINNITLYVGKNGETLNQVSTGAVTGNTDSNPNITHEYVTYADGKTAVYQGNATQYQICQTTFSGLNLLVDGGVKYNFGIMGDKYLWWNLASNAPLSGVRQDGADGKFLVYDLNHLNNVVAVDSGDPTVGIWDKSSDINVKVTGSAVPEPLTMIALCGAVSAVGTYVRRRARA